MPLHARMQLQRYHLPYSHVNGYKPKGRAPAAEPTSVRMGLQWHTAHPLISAAPLVTSLVHKARTPSSQVNPLHKYDSCIRSVASSSPAQSHRGHAMQRNALLVARAVAAAIAAAAAVWHGRHPTVQSPDAEALTERPATLSHVPCHPAPPSSGSSPPPLLCSSAL